MRGALDLHAVHELEHLVQQRFGADHRADAVTRNRQILGEAVEAHDVVVPVVASEQVVSRFDRRSEVAVCLVEDEHQASLDRQVVEGAEHVGRRGDTRRVGRRDEHDRASAVGDDGGRVLRVGHERRRAVSGRSPRGVEVHGPHALELQPHVVVEVVRHRQDHLVAGLGQRRQHDAERLIAAAGRQHVLRSDRAAVVPMQLGGERLAKRRQTGWRCVPAAVSPMRHLGDVIGDLGCRRVARRGLRQIEQRTVARAIRKPRMRLCDRRRREVRGTPRQPHGWDRTRAVVEDVPPALIPMTTSQSKPSAWTTTALACPSATSIVCGSGPDGAPSPHVERPNSRRLRGRRLHRRGHEPTRWPRPDWCTPVAVRGFRPGGTGLGSALPHAPNTRRAGASLASGRVPAASNTRSAACANATMSATYGSVTVGHLGVANVCRVGASPRSSLRGCVIASSSLAAE